MYAPHFGLREDPFGTAPDPRFLYFGREHGEALAALHYGLKERRGLLVLVAGPGLGKTTLLHFLLGSWREKADTAYLYRAPETREVMIAAVLEDLGVTAAGTYPENCRLLRERAASCRRRGRRLLVVFDEAQGIPADVLEEIRQMENLETPEEKLVDVVLAGLPAMVARWDSPGSEALRQRVGLRAEVNPLDAAEVRRYVDHRLRAAGRKRQRVFSRGALRLLAEASRGIPRAINTLCFEAMTAAFAAGKTRVGQQEMRAAMATAGGVGRVEAAPSRLRWAAAAAAALVVVSVVGVGQLRRRAGHAPMAAEPVWTVPSVAAAPKATAAEQPTAEAPAAPEELKLPEQAAEAPPMQQAPAGPTGSAVEPQAPAAEAQAKPGTTPDHGAGAVPEQVRVQGTDTMRQISLRRYGRWNEQVWMHIRKHNPRLTDPARLRLGQVILLPPREGQP